MDFFNKPTSKWTKSDAIFSQMTKFFHHISASLTAIFLVLFLIWLFLMGTSKYDGGYIFKSFFYDPFQSLNQLKKILATFAPFLLGALAVWICLRIGVINLGVSGQMSFAALSVYFFVYFLKKTDLFNDTKTPLLWLPVLFLVGILAASLLSAFCGVLKVYFGVNEVLSTIFTNYIVFYLFRYFISLEKVVNNITKLRTADAIGDSIAFNVFLNVIPITCFFVLFFFLLITVIFYKTKVGFKFKIVGSGQKVARYSGINVQKVTLSAFIIAGILAGIAGLFYYYRDVENTYLYKSEALPSNGFDTISIVWLSQSSLFTLPFVSFFVALIRTQQKVMKISSIDPVIVELLIGLMILFVAYFANLNNWKRIRFSQQFLQLKAFLVNPKPIFYQWKNRFFACFKKSNSPAIFPNRFTSFYQKLVTKKKLFFSEKKQKKEKTNQKKGGKK